MDTPIIGGLPDVWGDFDMGLPSEVQRKWNIYQLEDEYSNGLVYQDGSKYQVFADIDSKELLEEGEPIPEVVIKAYLNSKKNEFNNLVVRIFISTDGVKLLQQYKKVEVNSNQLVLFLEIDNKTNFTGSVVRLKAGSSVEKMKNFPMKEILNFAKERAVKVDAKAVKKLLKHAHRSKTGFFYWLRNHINEALQYVLFEPSVKVLEGLSRFFGKSVPEWMDNSLKLEKKHWNPKEKDNYNAIFIPDGIEVFINKMSENNTDNDVSKVVELLFSKVHYLHKSYNNYTSIYMANAFVNKMNHGINTVFEKIYAVENLLLEHSNDFWEMLNTHIEVANAILVGLYNSIIDTIKGIFQLIGFVFKGILELKNVSKHIGYYSDLASEMIENILEKIPDIDFVEVIKQFFLFPIKLFNLLIISISRKVSKVSTVEIGYFLGFLLGLIVETVISILFTGGTLTIEKILAKTFAEPFKALFGGIKKVIDKVKTLFEKVYIFVKKFFEKLKNPKKSLDELFKAIEEMFGVGKKEKQLSKAKINKLKIAKMWEDFTYDNLMKIPPTKKPCFLEGTLVHTRNGLQPIETVQIGDKVLCYDVIQHKLSQKKVTETFTNFAEKYLQFKTASGESIAVTGQHLFYQKETDSWVKAHQLQIGMQLYNPKTDTQEQITVIQVIEKQVTTYNLEVAKHHNYLVGKIGILAHNGKFSFSSTELIEVQFYALTESKKDVYVGQTTKEQIGARYDEHEYEVKTTKKDGITPKKHNARKKVWMDKVTGFDSILINGRKGLLKMTPFEAAVVESYELNMRDGKKTASNPKGLENRKNPVSEKSFIKYKEKALFNPCKFYA